MQRLSGRLRTFPALALLLALAPAPAIAGWQWLHPTPQGHDLHDVAFLTTSVAIAVGDAGTIMVSHDAGLTWSTVNKVNGITSSLHKIARIDDTTAIVVGSHGVVLKTTNAGATWQPRPSGTTLELHDVDFAGSHGMAVAASRVFQSVDGGDTWTLLPWSAQMEANGAYGGVEVVDGYLAMATQNFILWRTFDGGTIWDPLFLPQVPLNMGAVLFTDSDHGIVVGDHSRLFITGDGCLTWTEKVVEAMYSETAIVVNDLELLPSQEIIVATTGGSCDVVNPYRCSSHGEAQATTVGGAGWDWDQYFTFRPLTGVGANANGVRLFVGHGGVVHRWLPPADLAQTGGIEDMDELDGGALSFAGDQLGVAVFHFEQYFWQGYEYTRILRTSDGGATWSRAQVNHGVLHDVAFSPAGAPVPPAYAVGFDTDDAAALVTKSTDGGATWTPLWTDPAFPRLYGLDFATAARGVAVGDAGTVVVIDNDVATPATLASGGALRAVAFATPTDAVAVGVAGPGSARVAVIRRTTDGGDTWEPVGNAAAEWLFGVDFATGEIGVAAGSRGAVLRTTDGGATWDVLAPLTTADLLAVQFLDATHGFVCGAGGVVFETSDAGATWTPNPTPTTFPLVSMAPLGTTGAYFGGSGSTILKYEQHPVPTLITAFDAVASSFAVSLSWGVHDASDLDHFRVVREDPDHRVREQRVTADRRVFRDEDVRPGTRYEYRLFAVDRSGGEIVSAPVAVTVPAANVALLPNVPNPFNPTTTLRFVVPARERVTLAIYDVAGRHVRTLVDGIREAGMNEAVWNGTDANGDPVASGIYVTRLEVGTQRASRTIVLLK